MLLLGVAGDLQGPLLVRERGRHLHELGEEHVARGQEEVEEHHHDEPAADDTPRPPEDRGAPRLLLHLDLDGLRPGRPGLRHLGQLPHPLRRPRDLLDGPAQAAQLRLELGKALRGAGDPGRGGNSQGVTTHGDRADDGEHDRGGAQAPRDAEALEAAHDGVEEEGEQEREDEGHEERPRGVGGVEHGKDEQPRQRDRPHVEGHRERNRLGAALLPRPGRRHTDAHARLSRTACSPLRPPRSRASRPAGRLHGRPRVSMQPSFPWGRAAAAAQPRERTEPGAAV